MDNENKKTRREFLGDVLLKGSAAAVGGLVCVGLSPEADGAKRNINDIFSMTKIDPGMILYRESNKPVSTGFKESRFVTADRSGILYVVGDQAIRVMDPYGMIKNTFSNYHDRWDLCSYQWSQITKCACNC